MVPLRAALNSRAMPKSTSTTRPFEVSITLEGFMSRYTIGGVMLCRYASTSQSWRATSITRPSVQRLAASRGELFFEVAALDVLHHQVMAILRVEAIGDRGDRLMLQLREGVGLARKVVVGFEALLLVDEVIDHLLDRAGAIGEALVVREIDHAHSAAAKHPLDLIAACEHGAGIERSCSSHKLSWQTLQ